MWNTFEGITIEVMAGQAAYLGGTGASGVESMSLDLGARLASAGNPSASAGEAGPHKADFSFRPVAPTGLGPPRPAPS